MDVEEFDKFADEYLAVHSRNIAISGEGPEYFSRYKIDEVRRRWYGEKRAQPATILDFGTGIGSSLPFLASRFPAAAITGVDVSSRSLAIAEQRFAGTAKLVSYAGGADIPLPDKSFDLIFSACVFHHIASSEHAAIFTRLRALLKADGLMFIFEHNPLNPVTRYIVATCPFDENAVLMPAQRLRQEQEQAGFKKVQVAYAGFFPGALRIFRPLERFMTALPIGAQYYTMAHA